MQRESHSLLCSVSAQVHTRCRLRVAMLLLMGAVFYPGSYLPGNFWLKISVKQTFD